MAKFSRPAAVLAALTLAVALPGAAFAADVQESLTVRSAITVTGVPATVNYGSADPGQMTAPAQSFTADVTANGGWNLQVTGTQFTAPGSKVIASSAREMALAASGNATTTMPAGYTSFGDPRFSGTTGNDEATGTAGASQVTAGLRVQVPANAAAGTYTGTVSFIFTAN